MAFNCLFQFASKTRLGRNKILVLMLKNIQKGQSMSFFVKNIQNYFSVLVKLTLKF
jgi:hypothetical protein